MSIINRAIIALLLLLLIYALYRYQQSYKENKQVDNTVEEIAKADVDTVKSNDVSYDKENGGVINKLPENKIIQPKKVKFAKSYKGEYIDDDSINLDNISQLNISSFDSDNTNLSLESRNSMYSDDSDDSNISGDSLFDNLSLNSINSDESEASFFFHPMKNSAKS